MFALVALAAQIVVAAKNSPVNREIYVRELLKKLKEHDYDIKRCKRIMNFIDSVLNVNSRDISDEIRSEFYMQWVPTSQIQKEILIKDAIIKECKQEKAFEIAQKCRPAKCLLVIL